MKEFIISEAQTEKAVLVGLVTPEENGLPEFRHFCRDR